MLLKELLQLTEGVKNLLDTDNKPLAYVWAERNDGVLDGQIWIKCNSEKEFHSILQDESSKVHKFVKSWLKTKKLSFNDIEDFQISELADEGVNGFQMDFKI